jgi:hypothetical protein
MLFFDCVEFLLFFNCVTKFFGLNFKAMTYFNIQNYQLLLDYLFNSAF